MIEEFTSPEEVNLTSFVNSVQNLKENRVSKPTIYLVQGKPMGCQKMLAAVERTIKKMAQDMLLVRLDEHITRLELGFHAHFNKLLAQEINIKRKMSKEIREIVKEYLSPFEIEEKTRTIGFIKFVQLGKQQKLRKKTVYEEELEQDCWQCLNDLRQRGCKLVLLISSVEGFSKTASRFLTKFLGDYPSSVLLLGGSKPSLSTFLEETGISDYYDFSYLNAGEREEKEDEKVMYVAKAVLDAFSRAHQHFRYFKFEQHGQVEAKLLPGLAASRFKLAILAHLQMRHDHPAKLICTNYDCAILISILKKPVESEKALLDLCHAAYDIREGIQSEKDNWFEPWDTYIFVLVPSVSDFALESYRHLDYRNVFLLLPDGTFQNLSPHKWMDGILKEVSEQICQSKK